MQIHNPFNSSSLWLPVSKGLQVSLRWFLLLDSQASNRIVSCREWALDLIMVVWCLGWVEAAHQVPTQWAGNHTHRQTTTMWWNESLILTLITHLACFSFFFFSKSFAALPGVDILRCIPVIISSAINITQSRPIACIWNPYLEVDALPEAGALDRTAKQKCGTKRIKAAHFSPVIKRSDPMTYMYPIIAAALCLWG